MKSTRTIDGQRIEELDTLIDVLNNEGVKSILEIGSRYGDVIRTMAGRVGATKAVSVDLPNGPWGRPDSNVRLKQNIKKLKAAGVDAKMILGDSTSPEIIEQASELAPYDFVFIDGDHRYDGVRADWENYGLMGRIVGFHDILGDGLVNGKGQRMEVPIFWRQIRDLYKSMEIADSGSNCGIGLIWT